MLRNYYSGRGIMAMLRRAPTTADARRIVAAINAHLRQPE
jgi:hypothetical protein